MSKMIQMKGRGTNGKEAKKGKGDLRVVKRDGERK
jgi:hypothetical protein